MESSPSKKSPLLYRFFLKGYKNPNSAQNKPSCKIVSYIDKNNREKEEERYKRRQREPEAPDSDNLIAPPSPFNSTFTGPLVFSSQILEDEAPKLAPDCIEDSAILNVTWKCDPPEKVSPSPTPNYFQSSILNQRSVTEDSEEKRRAVPLSQSIRKFTETEAFYANHELIRTVVPPPTHTFSLPPLSPIAEPIYAEISSANKIKPQNKSPEQPPEPIQFEPVYENLDVIRQEMANRQPSPGSSPPKEGSFLSSSLPESQQPASLSLSKGEIDEESIIENKPAIKNYWETKMRENAASQFARSNFGVPPTTIIDKINEEIREDYMRNLELLQDEGLPRSSASDMSDEVIDFDSFDLASSNGSSPFGKPLQTSSPLMMPESPTLIDSGHQSQESHHPASESDLLDSPHNLSMDTRETSVSPQPSEPVNVHANRRSASPTPVPPPKQLLNGYGYRAPFEKQRLKSTGKIENHVTHYLQFNKLFSKTVKPIDEITPAPERTHPRPFKAAVYTPAPATVIAPPPPDVTSEEEKPAVKAVQAPEPPPTSLKPSAKGDDISYMMATSRLKKEIEDNLRREQELKEEGRVLTLSVETVASPPETRRIHRLSSNDQVVTIPADAKEPIHFNMEIPPPHQTQDSMAIETKIKIKRSASSPAKKPPAQPIQNIPAQATQEEPPVSEHTRSQQAAQPKTYAQMNQRNAPPQSLSFKLGKNFTSLERYIMYSSLTKLNYRSMPPVWNKSASQEILNEDHVEIKEDEDRDEPEKPRKYYVPAERKIKEELEEMVEREAELKKSRGQWKSTPNLSALDEQEPEEHKEEVEMRQPVGRRNTEKRRRSALISKWEDMISKYNQ